jgi:hypothetical protein
MAGDGGGWSESNEATKFVRKRLDDEKWRNEPTRDRAECDLGSYGRNQPAELQTDSDRIAVVTTGSQFAAQL